MAVEGRSESKLIASQTKYHATRIFSNRKTQQMQTMTTI
jgi:hypothetical protein